MADFKDINREERQLIDFVDKQKNLLRSMYDDFFGPLNVPGKNGSDKRPGSGNEQPAQPYAGPEAQAESEAVQQAPEEPEIDPMEQLNALIGLKSIKHDVKELTDFAKIQKMRKDAGMKSVPVSLHLVFSGNPGTGKTTVARILGRLYKKIGILSGGQLVEVDRSGLVAGYVGQTAIKTQEQIKKALGGVLFIDEAYSLSKKDDPFGEEAIDTVLKAMEDNRDNLVVIVAGYTEPMEKFINSNPGLKSRFNKFIEFPDYTVEELEGIFYQNCERYDYAVEEGVKHHIHDMIVMRKLTKQENFANAREVRNMFEEIITNQARRIAAMENPTQEQIMAITAEDLLDPDTDETEAPPETGKAGTCEMEVPPETEKAEAGEDSIIPESEEDEPGIPPETDETDQKNYSSDDHVTDIPEAEDAFRPGE